MAGQITHIVYGEKVRKKLLKEKTLNIRKYFVGNVFPDISYLKVTSREETHPKDPVVENLDGIENSFYLGIYVHALVDWEREKALTKLGLYKLVEKNPITSMALKLLEDEVTYPLYDKWDETISYFDGVLEEETDLVPKEAAEKWHSLLKTYFSKEKKAEDLISEIGFEKKIVNAVIQKMDQLRGNNKVLSIIKRTYFTELLLSISASWK